MARKRKDLETAYFSMLLKLEKAFNGSHSIGINWIRRPIKQLSDQALHRHVRRLELYLVKSSTQA